MEGILATRENWEFRFKACSAIAAMASALSIVIGSFVGIYTFRQQGLAAEALKEKELLLMQYNQKKEVYYQLVDAAASVAMSSTKKEAERNATNYSVLYFGKAHIFAIDPSVSKAKIAFRSAMVEALKVGVFPSTPLQSASLDLAFACKEVLRAQDVFSAKRTGSETEAPAKK